MVSEKELALVRKIHDKTLLGELKWEKTLIETEYQVSFTTSSISISLEGSLDDSSALLVLNIINDEGILIKRMTDEDLIDQMHNSFIFMKEIYINAKSKALNIENTIDELLKDLK